MKQWRDTPRTASGEEAARLVQECFRLHGALKAAADRLARDHGLTSARWQVLDAVWDEPRSVAGIGRYMGLTRQSALRSVARLELDGFVELIDNPEHRRARLVILTEKGRDTLSRLAEAQSEWIDGVAHQLEPVNLRMATGVLRGLTAGVTRQS